MCALAELLLTNSMAKLLGLEGKESFMYELRDLVWLTLKEELKGFLSKYFEEDQWSKSHDEKLCGEAVDEILICEN